MKTKGILETEISLCTGLARALLAVGVGIGLSTIGFASAEERRVAVKARADAPKAQEARASNRPGSRRIATQKRMRHPWERAPRKELTADR